MGTWGLSYGEYEERVGFRGGHRNILTLWNDLAYHLLRIRSKFSEPVDCLMPVDTLLALPPDKVQSIPGIGPSKAAVYRELYNSLKAHPNPLRDRSLDVSKEGLTMFAPVDTSGSRISVAFHFFWCHFSVGGDKPMLDHLEVFCSEMQDRKRRPAGFGKPHLELLEGWLHYLKKRR